MPRLFPLLLVLLLLGACSTHKPWINPPLPAEATPANPPAGPPPQTVMVAVTLSGGGARAAAFGLGVLKGLKSARFDIEGRPTSLLDEVVLVSGVSGGSILAAHYAAFGDATLTRFEPDFLLNPFEARLFQELLWPQRLYHLGSPWYGRTQILAQRLDELYHGLTFADLRQRPGAPTLMITATDLTTGEPFDFTAEQFDLICSDLGATPLSFAVAASSAVPLLLSPVTVQNHAGRCPPPAPARDTEHSYRAQLLQRAVEGYRDAQERPFIHLVDGGVTDNLGVRLLLDRWVASGSVNATFSGVPPGTVRQLVLVTVNAERGLAERLDRSDRIPTSSQVAEALIFGAGSRESRITLGMLGDDLRRWREELEQSRGQPGSPFAADAQIQSVNVSLHDVPDDSLRHRLLRVPTAFTIEAQDVLELQEAGTRALTHSDAFRTLMQTLQRLAQPPP